MRLWIHIEIKSWMLVLIGNETNANPQTLEKAFSPGDDCFLWLHVDDGLAPVEELLLDERLGLLHTLPHQLAHQHLALVETLQVHQLLGLRQLISTKYNNELSKISLARSNLHLMYAKV
jgi:hypothetical protein